ncbi:hypothetical protein C8Q80DRAFT_1211001 [Daedaleopsis nitida]|nr:hypothetical protein C8Q80DRAFT_1211001 [Daedaleopsis nitida]
MPSKSGTSRGQCVPYAIRSRFSSARVLAYCEDVPGQAMALSRDIGLVWNQLLSCILRASRLRAPCPLARAYTRSCDGDSNLLSGNARSNRIANDTLNTASHRGPCSTSHRLHRAHAYAISVSLSSTRTCASGPGDTPSSRGPLCGCRYPLDDRGVFLPSTFSRLSRRPSSISSTSSPIRPPTVKRVARSPGKRRLRSRGGFEDDVEEEVGAFEREAVGPGEEG